MVHRDFAAWPKALPPGGQGLHPSLGALHPAMRSRGVGAVEGATGDCTGQRGAWEGRRCPRGPAAAWEGLTHSTAQGLQGNEPPGKRSREGSGEACELHVGWILHGGKAGCLSPPKSEPWGSACLGVTPHPSTTRPQQRKTFSLITHPVPLSGQGNGTALCTRCRCQARPVAVAYGT